MKPMILDLFQKNGKKWVRNEQRKQAVKNKAFKDKLYPTFEDIHGEKRGEKNE